MRNDMAKILVERPRLGGGARYPRHRSPEGRRSPSFEDKASIPIDDSHEFRQIEGIWYELTLAPIPAKGEVFDIVLKVRVSDISPNPRSFYGRPVYCPQGGKRQLNSKEIRRLPTAKDAQK